MNAASIRLAEELKETGTAVIFDLNVDYLTPASGKFYYNGMQPSEIQRSQAMQMATLSDAVIADSSYLASRAGPFNRRVRWISDNVKLDLLPRWKQSNVDRKLTLFWSGEAVKLFELLRIADVLVEFRERIRLVIITNSLRAMGRWDEGQSGLLAGLLSRVEHEIVSFRSIKQLLEVYRRGGIFISPRFLDNSYNMGHTEWKIALAMACGRVAVCSPVPSYIDVRERANGVGIRICRDDDDWRSALDEVLSGSLDLREEEPAARSVIEKFYSTPVVASEHWEFVNKLRMENELVAG
jgi:glycosyltransferase involved in cell wall biosynthesis